MSPDLEGQGFVWVSQIVYKIEYNAKCLLDPEDSVGVVRKALVVER